MAVMLYYRYMVLKNQSWYMCYRNFPVLTGCTGVFTPKVFLLLIFLIFVQWYKSVSDILWSFSYWVFHHLIWYLPFILSFSSFFSSMSTWATYRCGTLDLGYRGSMINMWYIKCNICGNHHYTCLVMPLIH